MSGWAFTATDDLGITVRGKLPATDVPELRAQLQRQGLTLVKAKPARARRGARRVRLEKRALPGFIRDLATLDESGVPLISGLRDLSADRTDVSRAAAALLEGVQRGNGLSETMAETPSAFPREVIATTSAGEQSGSLAKVLYRLADYLDWKLDVRSQARQAMIYPCILGGTIAGLVVLMLVFMIPRLSRVFEKMRIELPLPTRIVMGASDFLLAHGLWVGLGVASVAAVIGVVACTMQGRRALHRTALRLPIAGGILLKIGAAQMCSSLSNLVSAGVALPRAMRITADVMPNRYIGVLVDRARERVEAGNTLAEALGETRLLPPLVRRMVSLGESTGTLDQTLQRVVRVFDREVPNLVQRLVKLIEPMTILCGGAVVAFMVIAAMMPIFKLLQSVT